MAEPSSTINITVTLDGKPYSTNVKLLTPAGQPYTYNKQTNSSGSKTTDKQGKTSFEMAVYTFNQPVSISVLGPDGAYILFSKVTVPSAGKALNVTVPMTSKQKPQPAKKACDGKICGDEGLTILPVRTTPVMIKGKDGWQETDNIPSLSGKFVGHDDKIALGNLAKYTLRILREGYLYVFNSARGSWDAYVVTEGGYYLPFITNKSQAEVTSAAKLPKSGGPDTPPFTCKDKDCKAGGSVIRIQGKKEQLDCVYLMFSEVEWTAEVFKEMHKNDAYKKIMQMLNIKQWYGSQSHARAGKLNQVDKLVTEFKTDAVLELNKHSAIERQNKSELVDLMKLRDQVQTDKGNPPVIFAVSDPTGMMIELDAILNIKQSVFMKKLSVEDYDFWLDGTIGAIKEQVETKGVDEYEAQFYDPPPLTSDNTPDLDGLFRPEKTKKIGYDNAKTAAWKAYKDKLDEGKINAGKQRVKDRIDAFQKTLSPLAEAHKAWFQNNAFNAYMKTCFDRKDKEANVAYTKVISYCIGYTAELAECASYYIKTLESGDLDHPLWRAMCLNNPELEKHAKEVPLTENVKLADLKWSTAKSALDTFLSGQSANYKGGTEEAIGMFFHRIAAPLLKLGEKISLSQSVASGYISRVCLYMGIYMRSSVGFVEMTGSKNDITRMLLTNAVDVETEMMLKHKGRARSSQKIEELKNRRKEFERLSKLAFERLVREGAIVPNGVDKEFRIIAVLDESTLANHKGSSTKTFINKYSAVTSYTQAHNQIRGQASMGAIGVVIQGWALYQMIKAGGFTKMDLTKSTKMTAAIMGPIGALMEFAGTFTHNAKKYTRLAGAKGLTPNIAFHSQMRVSGLLKWGKILGGVAGILAGVLDVVQGYKEADKGNILLSRLYYISAVAGGLAGIISIGMALGFFTVVGAPLLLFLFIVIVLVGAAISYYETQKILDWVGSTLWGKNTKFNNLSSAQVALDALHN